MPKDDERLRLLHMRNYADEAMKLSSGKLSTDLQGDRVLSLALTRLCELVGEAASKVPVETQRRYPEIPWPQIVGFRNRLIHGYDSVDLEIVWHVLTDDLPSLVGALEKILSDFAS